MDSKKDFYVEYLIEETKKKFAKQEHKYSDEKEKFDKLVKEAEKTKEEYYCF